MSGEARFVPTKRTEEDKVPPMEEEVDFGPDDFEEVSAPAMSIFDVDIERTSSSKETKHPLHLHMQQSQPECRKKKRGKQRATSQKQQSKKQQTGKPVSRSQTDIQPAQQQQQQQQRTPGRSTSDRKGKRTADDAFSYH
ncbi:hypothetical protein MBANPS3_012158 [Mucor bainieri]